MHKMAQMFSVQRSHRSTSLQSEASCLRHSTPEALAQLFRCLEPRSKSIGERSTARQEPGFTTCGMLQNETFLQYIAVYTYKYMIYIYTHTPFRKPNVQKISTVLSFAFLETSILLTELGRPLIESSGIRPKLS